jgi:hypothetical protein
LTKDNVAPKDYEYICDVCGKTIPGEQCEMIVYEYEDIQCDCHKKFGTHVEVRIVCNNCCPPSRPKVRCREDSLTGDKHKYIVVHVEPSAIRHIPFPLNISNNRDNDE